MVSQFVSVDKVGLLGELDYEFPDGIHAVGRLDSHSEGLLILTTNKRVTRLLFQGETPHKRTYVIRVKNKVSPENLELLRTGVSIRVKGGGYYKTPPCEVSIIEEPKYLAAHQLESRDYAAHTWLSMSLYEGKFHQVRKMVAAINHPCKRLIRIAIENLELGDLKPGEVREIEETTFFDLLQIRNWDKQLQ